MNYSLSRGFETLVINSPAAVPNDGDVSSSYAIPANVTQLSVSIRPVGTYVTLVVIVQVANNDVAGEYVDAYISTAVAGELVDFGPVSSRFFRIKVLSSTGASRTGLVVGVVGK